MKDDLSHDLPIEVRLHGHRVLFKLDVTGRVKATCRAFPDMLVRDDDFRSAKRKARAEVMRLTAARITSQA